MRENPNKITDEKGDVTTDITKIEESLKNYQQLYA
jgi:hypothetical protein